MIVLSLFDGMACGRLALHRVGIPVRQYISSEIDKYAIVVACANWNDIINLGCVTVVRQMAEAGAFGHVDLLIGGSPCQGFSFAGKQLAFDDPRSALFFEYVRILTALRKTNPNIKFMLENVRMKKQHLDVITQFLGVQPVCINSALVSAQNRVRYYWCNWSVSQPADRGIYLRDITESGEVDREKSYCIDANYYKGGSLQNYLEKSNSIVAFHQSEKRLMVRELSKFSERCQQQIKKNSKTENEKAIAVCANSNLTGSGVNILADGITYRKLTPIECERLQGLPDDYTNHVSNTQRYKMLGNGWQVDTIEHIFREMMS